MSCSCGCVAIPNRFPEICPKCIMLNAEYEKMIIGISTVEMQIDDVKVIIGEKELSKFDINKMKFFMSDVDDICAVNIISKEIFVNQIIKGENFWVPWDEYVKLVS